MRKLETLVNGAVNVLFLWENRNCFSDNFPHSGVRRGKLAITLHVIINSILLFRKQGPTGKCGEFHNLGRFSKYLTYIRSQDTCVTDIDSKYLYA